MRVLKLEAFIDFRNLYYSLAANDIEIDHGLLPQLLAELVEDRLNPDKNAILVEQLRTLLAEQQTMSKIDESSARAICNSANRLLAKVLPATYAAPQSEPVKVVVSQVFGIVSVPCNVNEVDVYAAAGVERFAFSLESRNNNFHIDRMPVDYRGFRFRAADRQVGAPTESEFTPSEKGVDTQLALRLQARCLANDRPDVVVLVSGDADLAPALYVASQMKPPIEAFVAGFLSNNSLSSVYRPNNPLGYNWKHEPIVLDTEIGKIERVSSSVRSTGIVGGYPQSEPSRETLIGLAVEMRNYNTRLRSDSTFRAQASEAVINWLSVRSRLLRTAERESNGAPLDIAAWKQQIYSPLVAMAKDFNAGFVQSLDPNRSGDWDKELEYWSRQVDLLENARKKSPARQ